jgi:hypothetical protein
MKLTIELTDKEMAKLQALADWRTEMSNGKVKYTPEKCIKGFIDSCQTGPSGWEPPDKTAQKFEAKKRAETQAADAKKDVVPSSTS